MTDSIDLNAYQSHPTACTSTRRFSQSSVCSGDESALVKQGDDDPDRSNQEESLSTSDINKEEKGENRGNSFGDSVEACMFVSIGE